MCSVVIIDNNTADIYKGNDFITRLNHIQHISIHQTNLILLTMDSGDVLAIYGKVVNKQRPRADWISRFMSAIRVRT